MGKTCIFTVIKYKCYFIFILKNLMTFCKLILLFFCCYCYSIIYNNLNCDYQSSSNIINLFNDTFLYKYYFIIFHMNSIQQK